MHVYDKLRDKAEVQSDIDTLMMLHDDIAGLKSHYTAHRELPAE